MSTETYRDQLSRFVDVMTVPNHEDAMASDLAEISEPSRIKMFVDGNLEKRMGKLDSQLGFVADAFDDFESLIGQYVRQSRLASYDTGTSDGEHMLIWLGESQSLTPDQRDYVTCQRARHAVEGIARKIKRLSSGDTTLRQIAGVGHHPFVGFGGDRVLEAVIEFIR
ncbi:MAG: hypothetical protein IH991_14275, partial [Planctomycetes bacterium]|nr:hypothetical protein [Planctomycetota bacterium]